METKWLNQITYFSVAPWSAVPTTARSGEREGDLNVELRGGEARNDDVERPCRRISWIARSLPTDSNFSYKILHYCRVSEQKKNVLYFTLAIITIVCKESCFLVVSFSFPLTFMIMDIFLNAIVNSQNVGRKSEITFIFFLIKQFSSY